MIKLAIKGKPGQGIQLLAFVLANFLKDNGFQVALTSHYSPLVRSGESMAFLVFSKKKIENPLIEKADWEYSLEKNDRFPRSANMVLLGLILGRLKLPPNKTRIKKYLPKKFQKENLTAIRYGYENF